MGAVTNTVMRPFDKNASGFLPGEGVGFVILKRMEEAIDDNDQIYAVLNGWGMASDGAGA